MKKALIIIVLVVLLIIVYSGSSKFRHGYYTPWGNEYLSYKKYNGSPDIDSIEFSQIIKKKAESGACRLYNTKYSNETTEKLEKMALINTDAMFELYYRYKYKERNDKWMYYLKKAARLGNINALIEMAKASPSRNEGLKKLLKYEKYTPLATESKIYRLLQKNDPSYIQEIEKLKSTGTTYPALLYTTAMYQVRFTGNLDKELMCEAYYNGCYIYDLIKKHKVTCKN